MRLFIGILIVVIAVFAVVAFVPPYWSNYQFEDAIKTEALMATNSTKSEDAIRDTVYKRAMEFDIPLDRDKIIVHHVGENGAGSVSIEAPYSVTVNIPGYPITLNFDPQTVNKGVF